MAKQAIRNEDYIATRRDVAELDCAAYHIDYFQKGCDVCSDRFAKLIRGGLSEGVVLDRQTITRIRWNLEAAGLLNVKAR